MGSALFYAYSIRGCTCLVADHDILLGSALDGECRRSVVATELLDKLGRKGWVGLELRQLIRVLSQSCDALKCINK